MSWRRFLGWSLILRRRRRRLAKGFRLCSTLRCRSLGAAFSPAAFFSALLKQIYLDQSYVPRSILVPVEFPDRALLAEMLTERTGKRVEILAPQRGEKRSLVDLVCQNAKQSYDQRFRVLQPGMKAIQEALQDALTLGRAAAPHRVLRHLAHSGRGDGRLHGGVGGRRDEEVRLPQVSGEDCHRRRRLCQHARGDPAPLQATAGREEAIPFPHPDRRRTWASCMRRTRRWRRSA